MICRIRCSLCGRTWVFDSRYLNPAEYSCPFHEEIRMNKKLLVKYENESGMTGTAKEIHAESIEDALRDLANQVTTGELETPCTLEFEGPGGLHFTIRVENDDDVHELNAQGFMF